MANETEAATAAVKAEALGIFDALASVQSLMSMPKDKVNEFGGFRYRTLEDINAEAKRAARALGISMSVTYNDRLLDGGVVESTCRVDCSGEHFETTSYARVSKHKGMSDEQCYGTASSYARKYAAQGMFAIDDARMDPDGMEPEQREPEQIGRAHV